MSKTNLNCNFLHELAANLPPECRAEPPDETAYRAYAGSGRAHRAEREMLWRLLVERREGYSLEDMIEVLDHPEASAEQLAAARPFVEAFPELAATMRRGRGPQKMPTKVQINLRVDPATLDHFKAGGPGWQVRMNEALDRAAGR